MSDVKLKYGTSNQAITITLASLGSTSLRESTAVDNSSNRFLDALVGGKVTTGSSGTSSSGYLNVYAYGTTDGGTTYSGDASGTDAAYSGRANNLRLLGVISAVTNSTTYEFGPFSVAAAFGGMVPDHWGLVFENLTGHAISASDQAVTYQGVYSEVV